MRERRRRDTRVIRSPPRPTYRRTDSRAGQSWRFSRRGRSPSPLRSVSKRSRPAGFAAGEERGYADVSTGEGEYFDPCRWASDCKPLEEPNRSVGMGSAQWRKCGRSYEEENSKRLSQFCESSSKNESTLMKFKWDKLLVDKPISSEYPNSVLSRFNECCPHVASDSGVVPSATPVDNVGSRDYNHEAVSSMRQDRGLVPRESLYDFESKRSEKRTMDLVLDTMEGNGIVNDTQGRVFSGGERNRISKSKASFVDSGIEMMNENYGRDSTERRDLRENRNVGSLAMRSPFEVMGSAPRVSFYDYESKRIVRTTSVMNSDVDVMEGNGGNQSSLGRVFSEGENSRLSKSKTSLFDFDMDMINGNCGVSSVGRSILQHLKGDTSPMGSNAVMIEGGNVRPRDNMGGSKILDSCVSISGRYSDATRVSQAMLQRGIGMEELRNDHVIDYGGHVFRLEKPSKERESMGSLPIESLCEKIDIARARTNSAGSSMVISDGHDTLQRDGTEIRRWSDGHSHLRERCVVGSRGSHPLAQVENERILGCGGSHGNHGLGNCLDFEYQQLVEDCDFQKYGHIHFAGTETLPLSQRGLYATERSPAETSTDNAYEMMVPRNYSLEMQTRGDNQIINDTDLQCVRCHEQDWPDQDCEQFQLLQHFGSPDARTVYANEEVISNASAKSCNPLSSPHLPISKHRHSSKILKPSSKDIKQRLGSFRNIKQRLGTAKSVRHRLGPVSTGWKALVSFKNCRKKSHSIKISKRRSEDIDRGLDVQGIEASLYEKKKTIKNEPAEDSNEFVKLMHRFFFKFAKVLNENSAQRKKYMVEEGNASLKCSICGSNSKEYTGTISLAQHAFKPGKVGSRAEHLGLHKALCVMMGWESKEHQNGPWVQRLLPIVEAISLQEDLIIWPPVVIFHNISIAYGSRDDRIIVSINELSEILRGIGFGQEMTNLYRGRAANNSIMVVSFQGTFPGLREAERLHRFCTENKQGRAEFQKINFDSCDARKSEQAQGLPAADRIKSLLYGYLGIAGDLDKLDFETEKRCVVKSKKEIVAIANGFPSKE